VPRFRNFILVKVKAAIAFIDNKGEFLEAPLKNFLRHFRKLNNFLQLWGLKAKKANSGLPLYRSDQNLLDRGSVLW
jgi:hypothetical protein